MDDFSFKPYKSSILIEALIWFVAGCLAVYLMCK
jgi:hypothetical protein